jgi:hypothetical protein
MEEENVSRMQHETLEHTCVWRWLVSLCFESGLLGTSKLSPGLAEIGRMRPACTKHISKPQAKESACASYGSKNVIFRVKNTICQIRIRPRVIWITSDRTIINKPASSSLDAKGSTDRPAPDVCLALIE